LRYALYFSPAQDDVLTETAARWLGRNAFTGEMLPTPEVEGLSAETVHALTADPRRYGFHATLKAPFALRDGAGEAELLAEAERFAAETPAFEIPNVIVGQIGRFFAIVPDQVYPVLQDFTADVVETFEPYRAPLSDADIARRKPDALSEKQRAYLHRYGYPYVMEEFRFHMTLSGQVPPDEAPAMHAALDARFGELVNKPLAIDALSIFVEPERGADFIAYRRFSLTGALQNRKTAS
jgi:putative phosphonate metabolism protein